MELSPKKIIRSYDKKRRMAHVRKGTKYYGHGVVEGEFIVIYYPDNHWEKREPRRYHRNHCGAQIKMARINHKVSNVKLAQVCKELGVVYNLPIEDRAELSRDHMDRLLKIIYHFHKK